MVDFGKISHEKMKILKRDRYFFKNLKTIDNIDLSHFSEYFLISTHIYHSFKLFNVAHFVILSVKVTEYLISIIIYKRNRIGTIGFV